jgi:hypothetical protein
MGSTHLKAGSFPIEMAFQGNWRTYQARLLDRLDMYLEDKRLHVVAAPGSGKTILGLEAIRRINRPTLLFWPQQSRFVTSGLNALFNTSFLRGVRSLIGFPPTSGAPNC